MGLFNSIGNLFGGGQGMPQPMPPVQPGTSFDEAFAPFLQQQQPRRPGFNDPGGFGEKLQGIGAIWQDNPQAYSQFQEMQQRRADALRAQQMAEQQRMAGREDKQWEWQNKPKEPPSDSFLRAMEAAGLQPGTPQYIEMARKRAQMLTNPVQLVPDAMGGMTPVRPQEMVNAPPEITEDDWNSGQPMGGGGVTATGGFP